MMTKMKSADVTHWAEMRDPAGVAVTNSGLSASDVMRALDDEED